MDHDRIPAPRTPPANPADSNHQRKLRRKRLFKHISLGYVSEVRRWIKTHGGSLKPCPGIDFDFDTDDVREYLGNRALTTKALSGILSALKQMGMLCGFVLHTSKFQQPSLQYQLLRHEVGNLHKARRDAGLDTGINQAVGTGKFAISQLLSAFSLFSFRQMCRLHPQHREFICQNVMQYRGCSRYGLFHYTTPKHSDLRFVEHSNCYRLSSTWRKTGKSNKPYTITYPVSAADDTDAFVVKHPSGPTMVSTGMIIHWYLRALQMHNGPPTANSLLFPLTASISNRRAAFAKWLRSMYVFVLPAGSTIPQRIRPHSNRAGWATDHVRKGTNAEAIMAHGRWSSRKAMNEYIRSLVSDLCHSSAFRYIPKVIRRQWDV